MIQIDFPPTFQQPHLSVIIMVINLSYLIFELFHLKSFSFISDLPPSYDQVVIQTVQTPQPGPPPPPVTPASSSSQLPTSPPSYTSEVPK